MAEDKDPLVDEDEENGEEELPESPALVDHTVDSSGPDKKPGKDVDLSARGVSYVREPNGKLTPERD